MSSGIKKFVDYTSLPAFDINEYLMNQTVMVFASSAARTSAFSTAGVTITEGMVTYLLDTDQLNVWSGSAWIGITAASVSNTGTVNIASNGLNALVVNTTGIVQTPYVPTFAVYCGFVDGHAAITSGVFTATTVPLNNGSHFRTSGTGAYQNFYAPVAGYYHFDFHWTILSGTAGNYYGAYFQVDGTSIHGGYVSYFKHYGGNDDSAASINSIFYLTANQNVRVAINNQTNVRFQFARFSGHLIG